MITIKTPKEIEIIKEAGKKLAQVKRVVASNIKPGIKLLELDRIADSEIVKLGAEAAFKRVYGYKWATCININEGVVHGIPNDCRVRAGDKVSVDVGIYFKGFNVDSAFTFGVKPVDKDLARFINIGKTALDKAIKEARVGNRVGHISVAIEKVIKGAGYSPVRLFTGHGVGADLHEEPIIPCFLYGKVSDTPKLSQGMVLAIEAIYTEGNFEVVIELDNWTARTQDGKMGGLFEETVVVTNKEPLIVT